jgi:hypothetical protein
MAQDYFVDSLTVDPEVCPSQVLSHVEPKVTELMNEGLCREFSERDIRCDVPNGSLEGTWPRWLLSPVLSETLGHIEHRHSGCDPEVLL